MPATRIPALGLFACQIRCAVAWSCSRTSEWMVLVDLVGACAVELMVSPQRWLEQASPLSPRSCWAGGHSRQAMVARCGTRPGICGRQDRPSIWRRRSGSVAARIGWKAWRASISFEPLRTSKRTDIWMRLLHLGVLLESCLGVGTTGEEEAKGLRPIMEVPYLLCHSVERYWHSSMMRARRFSESRSRQS